MSISQKKSGLGERLRFLRENKGLSREDFAKNIGLTSPSQVSRYESGKCYPSVPVLIKIASVLDADLHWIIVGSLSPGIKSWRTNFADLARITNTLIAFENERLEREKADFKKQLFSEQEKESKGLGTQIGRIEYLKEAIAALDNSLSQNTDRQHWIFERLYGKSDNPADKPAEHNP